MKKLLCSIVLAGLVIGQMTLAPMLFTPTAQSDDPVVSNPLIQITELAKRHKTAWQMLQDPQNVEMVTGYGEDRLRDMCTRQPENAWCPGGNRTKQTKLLESDKIRNLSNWSYDHFEYTRDVEDTWNVNSEFVRAELEWFGDCDDITSTTLHIIHEEGQNLGSMWMLLVNSKGSGLLDHVVGVVMDVNGKYWVVGDTSKVRNNYPLEELAHRPMAIARMDNPYKWIPVTESTVFMQHPDLIGAPEAERNQ